MMLIEKMALEALAESERKNKVRENLQRDCAKGGHAMRFSPVYRTYICKICGHICEDESGKDRSYSDWRY